jgi:hypothetical protein
MDYDPLFKLPTGVEDIESVFKTGRGSTYAFHKDITTTRNRSGEKHTDRSTGIQPRSGKTVFMSEADVNRVAGLFQNPDMATRLVPVMDEQGKPTGKAKLELLEDYGPRKAGSVLAVVNYRTKPEVGLAPVEIYASESKIGDPGRYIHFGNTITEVHSRPSRLGPAKLAGIGALVGGAGAANAGEYRRAAADIAESLLPLGMTPSTLAPGTLPPEVRAAQDAEYRARQQQQQQARMKAQALLRSGVPMPEEYRQGGRVRMI